MTGSGSEGPFAGWTELEPVGFNALAGPFYGTETDGRRLCGLFSEARHLNPAGGLHGGCLATLADMALAWISAPATGGRGVTIQLDCSFVASAGAGAVLIGSGEIVRAGRSLVFARGLISSGEQVLLSFSGVTKALRR